MSSNLLSYKFKSKQWHKADGINESDVAVIVDSSRDLIWYFEGKNSSARKRNKARNSLGDLKSQHATYKFKKVDKNTPRDIVREFAILKEDFYINAIKNLKFDVSKISRVYFYLNAIGGLLNITCFVFSLLILVDSNIIIFDEFLNYSISFSNFNLYIYLLSTSSLISCIFYGISSIITILFKQKTSAVFNMLGSVLTFNAFFLLCIWEVLIYSNVIAQQVVIRIDVFIVFNLYLQSLFLISLIIAFIMGSIGFKRVDQIIHNEPEE